MPQKQNRVDKHIRHKLNKQQQQCRTIQKRFIRSCVHGGPYESLTGNFTNIGNLYVNRWDEVVKFCKSLNEFAVVFRGCWDERRFREEMSSNSVRGSEETKITLQMLLPSPRMICSSPI